MFGDLYLQLQCSYEWPEFYVILYIAEVPEAIDTYTVGIWDSTVQEYEGDLLTRPFIHDDDGYYAESNRAVMGRIVTLMKAVVDGPPGRTLDVSLRSLNDEDYDDFLISEFNPQGVYNALAYLDCYP